ncbi:MULTISPECIES: hypothetical protein [unclassified Halomonas]|uniref:hypothetical protein n=1 Tax=unclassified Halomonas TaxID=2609666 RepID=UPI0020769006|nr:MULTISPECIES: hypothetical protein [unclassified Halomonas]
MKANVLSNAYPCADSGTFWPAGGRILGVTAAFLLALPWLLALGDVEAWLALAGVAAGGAAQWLGKATMTFTDASTCMDASFLTHLEALGAACVGTLLLLYVLA